MKHCCIDWGKKVICYTIQKLRKIRYVVMHFTRFFIIDDIFNGYILLLNNIQSQKLHLSLDVESNYQLPVLSKVKFFINQTNVRKFIGNCGIRYSIELGGSPKRSSKCKSRVFSQAQPTCNIHRINYLLTTITGTQYLYCSQTSNVDGWLQNY